MPSRVITFRLHPNDTEEARALEVLVDLETQGYDTRTIMTHALIKAAGMEVEATTVGSAVRELKKIMLEFGNLVSNLKNIDFSQATYRSGEKEGQPVDEEEFFEDLFSNFRTGRIDEEE